MRRLITPLIYLAGLCCLILCDVVVTKFLNADDIALWAQVRSLVGLAGIGCLIGFDQVLVRSPQSSGRLLRLLAVQVPVLAILVATGIAALGFLNSWWSAFGLAMGSAGSLVMFQYYRSHYHSAKSQLSQQGWKIGALLAVAWMIWQGNILPLDTVVVGLFALTVGLGVIGVAIWPPAQMRPQDPEPVSRLYAIGVRFMVTSLFLALAIYAEQLVVNGLGDATQAASYFTHATYFLFPISVVNGYVAFRIGPWIRDNHDRYLAVLRRRVVLIGVGVVAYCLCISAVGWVGWQIVAPQAGRPDLLLQLTFGVSCLMRTFYVLAAGYIGVFAQPRQHDLMIAGQVISFAVVVALFWATYGPVWGLLHAVAIASAINWALRTMVAFATMGYVVRIKRQSPSVPPLT